MKIRDRDQDRKRLIEAEERWEAGVPKKDDVRFLLEYAYRLRAKVEQLSMELYGDRPNG